MNKLIKEYVQKIWTIVFMFTTVFGGIFLLIIIFDKLSTIMSILIFVAVITFFIIVLIIRKLVELEVEEDASKVVGEHNG